MQNSSPTTVSLALTGASGMPYGLRLLECLLRAEKKVYLMLSPAALVVLAMETELQLPGQSTKLQEYFCDYFKVPPEQLSVFSHQQWSAPIASGSAAADAMVICPCSSGCVAAIAQGTSDNLIERAADVMIKEKRPLIIVHRETPLSPIHLENLLKLAHCGVTILPANPGFYHNPTSINDLIDFVIARVLDHLHIKQDLVPRWG